MNTPIDWGSYLAQILVVVVPALAVFLVTAITYGTYLFKRKMEASTKLDEDSRLQIVTKAGVYLAEEKSEQEQKKFGTPLTGDMKATVAANYVLDRIPDASLLLLPSTVKAQVGATLGVGASKGVGDGAGVDA